jgi:hypothetical protein
VRPDIKASPSHTRVPAARYLAARVLWRPCRASVPAHVKALLWTYVIRNAMFLIVEGLSQAKRVCPTMRAARGSRPYGMGWP